LVGLITPVDMFEDEFEEETPKKAPARE